MKKDEVCANIDEPGFETIESLKKSSPFSLYFKNVLKGFEEKIKNAQYNSKGENVFFNPTLFALIVDQLYLLPLWTGITIDDFKKNYKFDLSVFFSTRLSNNPVENYFGLLKIEF